MKYSKIILLFVFVLIISCKQNEEARRPVSYTSGSFMKKSIIKNKKLITGEESQIDSIIKNNPNTKYVASTKGYWYTYEIQNQQDTLRPNKGDIAFFDYEIKDLKGTVIYSQAELKPQTYTVDKQEIMSGLADGLKLMHKKEKVNFLFPSHLAYGYHGDTNKIGINQPLLCTVTLRNFMPLKTFRENQLKAKATITPNPETVQKLKDTLTQ